MPRKTKDLDNKEVELEDTKVKKTTKSTAVKKKTPTAKNKASTKSAEVTPKKAVTKKSSSTTKKTTEKKADAKKKTSSTVKKAKTTKSSSTTKKSVAKKTTTKKVTTKKTTKKSEVVEYYDLPYRYNQTVVKILAQTPTNLFIYWDISDEDRENYKKQYGDNFFETTKPILKVYNDTMNYSFEVDINDFANSWYLRINDSKCDYRVELGRRPITFQPQINTDYIYISSSNKIESPNDRILFDKLGEMVYFRNTKTNTSRSKSIASLAFIKNMGRIYNIYNLYKELYNDEDINNLYNPSSRFF